MKLRLLSIELQPSYSDNAGQYVATIAYEDRNKSDLKMVLHPDISAQLLNYIGPVLTKFAARASKEIEENILASLAEVKNLPEIPLSSSAGEPCQHSYVEGSTICTICGS
jgi:hypothetical protein